MKPTQAFAALLAGTVMSSACLLSQENDRRHQPRYKLIDLGTFGGPNSSLPGSNESLNPSGVVTGCADTSVLDPDFAIQNPYFSDPYIERSYIWNDGHRTALPALRGGRNTGPQWINESASIVGASENGQVDPLTGLKEVHAVLWDPERRIHDLGTLGGNGSVAWVINDAGQVAGDSLNDIPDDLNASGAVGLPGLAVDERTGDGRVAEGRADRLGQHVSIGQRGLGAAEYAWLGDETPA